MSQFLALPNPVCPQSFGKKCGRNGADAYPAPSLIGVLDELSDNQRGKDSDHAYPVACGARADMRLGMPEALPGGHVRGIGLSRMGLDRMRVHSRHKLWNGEYFVKQNRIFFKAYENGTRSVAKKRRESLMSFPASKRSGPRTGALPDQAVARFCAGLDETAVNRSGKARII